GSTNGGTNPPESTTPESTTPESTTTESTTTESADTSNPDNVIPETLSSSKLPNTGGAPLPGALFGLAAVAAGILSVGLMVRRGR
ncbi:MAG TPA: hypothetical protein VFI90_11115, partial [Rubrobacter sp.]|nr:hypothetical protein [Rubrobacter sp.]